MKTKLVSLVLVSILLPVTALPAPANEDPGALNAVMDVAVVRPGCLAATIVGSAFFVVSLPIAAASKSVKKTARTLVINPAKATFTRKIGDMESLKFSTDL